MPSGFSNLGLTIFCTVLLCVSSVSTNVSSNTTKQNFRENLPKKSMAPKVERVSEIGTIELGEGPHWDADTQSLYFVDIFGKAIHKYVPATKKHTKAVIGKKD